MSVFLTFTGGFLSIFIYFLLQKRSKEFERVWLTVASFRWVMAAPSFLTRVSILFIPYHVFLFVCSVFFCLFGMIVNPDGPGARKRKLIWLVFTRPCRVLVQRRKVSPSSGRRLGFYFPLERERFTCAKLLSGYWVFLFFFAYGNETDVGVCSPRLTHQFVGESSKVTRATFIWLHSYYVSLVIISWEILLVFYFVKQKSSSTRKMMASETANGSLPSVILTSSTVGTSSAASMSNLRDHQHNLEGAKERKERQMRRLTADMDDLRAKWVVTVSWFPPLLCHVHCWSQLSLGILFSFRSARTNVLFH